MSITHQIDRIIRARWNPGEWLRIQEVVDIARSMSITEARPTIQRTMQELRDRGIVRFSSSRNRGRYQRMPVAGERFDGRRSVVRQAAAWLNDDLKHNEPLRMVTAQRILRSLNEEEDSQAAVDISRIYETDTADTERLSLVKARLGQGEFRAKLLEHWNRRCALTGCGLTKVLRASHIKPWRDSTNEERLDAYNGLLLIPNLDALFDAGLITLEADGSVQRSSVLRYVETGHLGIPGPSKACLRPEHRPYLEYHQKRVFIV
jgi:DNA-binding transcriptional ArsR family regulator